MAEVVTFVGFAMFGPTSSSRWKMEEKKKCVWFEKLRTTSGV